MFSVEDALLRMRELYKCEDGPAKELYKHYGMALRRLLDNKTIMIFDEYDDVKDEIWNETLKIKDEMEK